MSALGKTSNFVPTIQSNADALVVAIPMIVILFLGFFRLDELVAQPPRKSEPVCKLSGWDESGRPVCTDPDGKPF
jgi:hypothetical protein